MDPGRIERPDEGDAGNGVRTRHKRGVEDGRDFCDDFKSHEDREDENRDGCNKYFHKLVVVMEKMAILETKFSGNLRKWRPEWAKVTGLNAKTNKDWSFQIETGSNPVPQTYGS